MTALFSNLESEKQRIREAAVAGWGVVQSTPGTRNGVDMAKSEEPELTKKFNPAEARDPHGRWTIGAHVEITSGVYRGQHGTVLRSNPDKPAHDIMLDGGRGRQAHQVPADALTHSDAKPDVSQHMSALETMAGQQPGSRYAFDEAKHAFAKHNYAAARKWLGMAAQDSPSNADAINSIISDTKRMARDEKALRETNRPIKRQEEPGMSPAYAQQLRVDEVRSLSPKQRAVYMKAREAGMAHGTALRRATGTLK